jgi:hypothetical protein
MDSVGTGFRFAQTDVLSSQYSLLCFSSWLFYPFLPLVEQSQPDAHGENEGKMI